MKRGLTLLEVLVAAVLVSAGAIVLSSAVSGSIRAATEAERRSTAARLADSVLARIEAEEISVLESSEGTFEDDGEADYWYEVDTEEGEEANLREVTVRVLWLGPEGERSFEVVRSFFNRQAAIVTPEQETP
ncbi:MAG: prepilin-type N-terminal cleavage/methylation domain-containing protein [Planctomycetes bacterium]|nr:prepilin-type N-terminal cleavage/methylation domain-containing protein [Planctomycetota bacterium]